MHGVHFHVQRFRWLDAIYVNLRLPVCEESVVELRRVCLPNRSRMLRSGHAKSGTFNRHDGSSWMETGVKEFVSDLRGISRKVNLNVQSTKEVALARPACAATSCCACKRGMLYRVQTAESPDANFLVRWSLVGMAARSSDETGATRIPGERRSSEAKKGRCTCSGPSFPRSFSSLANRAERGQEGQQVVRSNRAVVVQVAGAA